MGSIGGCAGVFRGSRNGTSIWNTYQLKVCAPTAVVGWKGDGGGSPTRGAVEMENAV